MDLNHEQCSQCGFDSELYDIADTISSQSVIPAVLRAAIEGLDGGVLQQRPDGQTWSIAEYLDHVREVAFGNRFAIESALADPGVDLGDAPQPTFVETAREVDVAAALDAIDAEYREIGDVLAALTSDEWAGSATVGGSTHSVGWFARHVLHDGLHHLGDIGRIRHRLGHGAATERGVVVQLSVSGGGVPKLAVGQAVISARGMQGDSQNDRRHHGRPVQAICLWGAEVIAQLQSEGHPIAAGNAGENVTIEGINWAALRPGSLIQIGAVPMLITAHAIPCAKNAQWFSDRDFRRILHDRNPGLSRLYAIPLSSASVAVGDEVVVEP